MLLVNLSVKMILLTVEVPKRTTRFGDLADAIDAVGLKCEWRVMRAGRGKDNHAQILRYLYMPANDKLIDSAPRLWKWEAPECLINKRDLC